MDIIKKKNKKVEDKASTFLFFYSKKDILQLQWNSLLGISDWIAALSLNSPLNPSKSACPNQGSIQTNGAPVSFVHNPK